MSEIISLANPLSMRKSHGTSSNTPSMSTRGES